MRTNKIAFKTRCPDVDHVSATVFVDKSAIVKCDRCAVSVEFAGQMDGDSFERALIAFTALHISCKTEWPEHIDA